MQKYRKAKKARNGKTCNLEGKINYVAATLASPQSSLLKASFAKEKFESNVIAAQGANASFILASFLEKLKELLTSRPEEKHGPSLIYRNVSVDPCITCAKLVFLDVFLQIRHRSSLILRNVNWKITNENRTTPTIKRGVLEFLACDNRRMFLAARNRMGDDIDVSEKPIQYVNEEEHEGVMAALYGESVFHSRVYAKTMV